MCVWNRKSGYTLITKPNIAIYHFFARTFSHILRAYTNTSLKRSLNNCFLGHLQAPSTKKSRPHDWQTGYFRQAPGKTFHFHHDEQIKPNIASSNLKWTIQTAITRDTHIYRAIDLSKPLIVNLSTLSINNYNNFIW